MYGFIDLNLLAGIYHRVKAMQNSWGVYQAPQQKGEQMKKPTVESLVFTLGFVIGIMLGVLCLMVIMLAMVL